MVDFVFQILLDAFFVSVNSSLWKIEALELWLLLMQNDHFYIKILCKLIFLAGIFFWGPSYLYCVIPSPTQVPSMSKMYFIGQLTYMDKFHFHCHCQLSWIYLLGSTNLYCVLPRPTQIRSMSKMYFVGLLIYIDNFYFHCHCQFSWIYIFESYLSILCPTKSQIGSQCVKNMFCWSTNLYR